MTLGSDDMAKDDKIFEENKSFEELEKEEIDIEKKLHYSSYEADGLPGSLLERNIGLAEALPKIFLFYTGPTSIVVAFSVLVASKSVVLTIMVEILFYLFFVVAFTQLNTYMGNKFYKIGGKELIIQPVSKTLFSFNKLFVFLIIASLIPAIIEDVNIDIPTLRPIMFAFLAVYFIDVIAKKIIDYLQNEIFYDPVVDKKKKKVLNIIDLIECIISILAFGLVLFPLSLEGETYGIAIYITIVVILAIVFTIIDHIVIKKNSKKIENTTSKDDEVDIYYDIVDKYRVLAYILFFWLHIIFIVLCFLAWF